MGAREDEPTPRDRGRQMLSSLSTPKMSLGEFSSWVRTDQEVRVGDRCYTCMHIILNTRFAIRGKICIRPEIMRVE